MATSPRRERKVVSVLFADLVGFTSRSDSLDPEDVEAILTPYHAQVQSELRRFGGSVEKFIGDAVVAVFGAPVAHEDDAERAVRAALAIRDWAREAGFELRVAVNTGEALVSLDADPASGDHAVAGDVLNTASRMQLAAPVNGVLVGEATYRATESAIEYRAAEPAEARGKAAPVPVWEALEPRSRLGSDVTHQARVPLVGRARELDVLRHALARAREERTPQLVTLVGVPGIGKSRLVYELSRLADDDPELISWRQGRCLPYGEGVAFWALAEMVKAQAGILEGDAADAADAKLAATIDRLLEDETEAAWVRTQLRPLLGLGGAAPSEEHGRTEGFAAWRRFFEALAEERPLVLVVEDLHWADDGLLDFVDYLVEWAVAVPILVVATARPELLARRPDWGGGKSNAVTLSLSPLAQRDTARLLHALLDRVVLRADVQERLLERAGGNPLYAEEFARITTERGALGESVDVPLPESVHGLIAARIDGLPMAEKSLLQDAAVVGKVFWLGAVASLGDVTHPSALEQSLHGLERKQFIRRERRSGVAGDTQYAFAHGLVQEVAYRQIPRAERAERHRRAAEWIDALGRPEDHAEMRAHHYVEALEAAQAAGTGTASLEREARLALRDAGDRAFALNAYTAASRHYDRALRLWPKDDDGRPRLLFAAASARFEAEQRGDEEEVEAARDALLEAGDRDGVAEAEVMLANMAWVRGRGEETLRHLERAAEVAEPLPSSPSKAYAYMQLARFHMLADRIEIATRFGQAAYELAEEHGLEQIRADALNTLGTIRATYGDRAGLDDLERSIEIGEAANSPRVVRAYNNLAYTLFRLGELERYNEIVARMAVGVDRFAFPDWRRWLADREAIRLYYTGRWDEALVLVDRMVAETPAIGGHYLEPSWRYLRSRIRLARGGRDEAEDDFETALELARVSGDPQVLVPLLAWGARVRSPGPEAPRLLAEVQQLVRKSNEGLPHSWFVDVARALVELGRGADIAQVIEVVRGTTPWFEAGLALADGRPSEAAHVFARIGARPDEAEARLAAAELLASRGRLAEARAELAPAKAFFESVGADAYVQRAERLVAASA